MPRPPENYASLLRSRRGYLGINGAEGASDVLPVCFTWAGDTIWIVVDPRVAGTFLERHRTNGGPKVPFMVDRWDEDWYKLQWLVAKGDVTVLEPGEEEDGALEALESKYPQYLQHPIQEVTIVRLDVEEWVGWDALGEEDLT
ncbi:MAG TPA: TIGR03668 family PPOX class F420-dependent oxidoreductase [Actinomycetota bacterium]|nr:TIGR03668 family PPOX class F420-dependent oxidoreductase [Actinomycetota bacterium]